MASKKASTAQRVDVISLLSDTDESSDSNTTLNATLGTGSRRLKGPQLNPSTPSTVPQPAPNSAIPAKRKGVVVYEISSDDDKPPEKAPKLVRKPDQNGRTSLPALFKSYGINESSDTEIAGRLAPFEDGSDLSSRGITATPRRHERRFKLPQAALISHGEDSSKTLLSVGSTTQHSHGSAYTAMLPDTVPIPSHVAGGIAEAQLLSTRALAVEDAKQDANSATTKPSKSSPSHDRSMSLDDGAGRWPKSDDGLPLKPTQEPQLKDLIAPSRIKQDKSQSISKYTTVAHATLPSIALSTNSTALTPTNAVLTPSVAFKNSKNPSSMGRPFTFAEKVMIIWLKEVQGLGWPEIDAKMGRTKNCCATKYFKSIGPQYPQIRRSLRYAEAKPVLEGFITKGLDFTGTLDALDKWYQASKTRQVGLGPATSTSRTSSKSYEAVIAASSAVSGSGGVQKADHHDGSLNAFAMEQRKIIRNRRNSGMVSVQDKKAQSSDDYSDDPFLNRESRSRERRHVASNDISPSGMLDDASDDQLHTGRRKSTRAKRLLRTNLRDVLSLDQDVEPAEAKNVQPLALSDARKGMLEKQNSMIQTFASRADKFYSFKLFSRESNRSAQLLIRRSVLDVFNPVLTYTGMSGDAQTVAWSPDDRYIAVGSIAEVDSDSMQYNRPNNLLFGDIEGKTLFELPEHHRKREKAATGVNATHEMHVTQDPRLFFSVNAVRFSDYAGAQHLYSAGFDGCVRAYNVENGTPTLIFEHDHGVKVDLLASCDLHGIFVTGSQSIESSINVFIRDRDTIDLVETLKSEKAAARPEKKTFPTALQFGRTPGTSGFLLAGYSSSFETVHRETYGEVCLWDMQTGTNIKISPNSGSIYDVTWSPREDTFAIARNANGTVEKGTRSQVFLFSRNAWSGGFGRVGQDLECPALDINELVLCPHSRDYVAVGATDGNVYIWDIRNPSRLLHTLSHDEPIAQQNYVRGAREKWDCGVRFCTWGYDITRLFSGSSDGVVKTWDIRRATEDAHIDDIACFDSEVMSGQFNSDFTKLLIGETKGAIHVLEAGPHRRTVGQFRFKPAEKASPISNLVVDSAEMNNALSRQRPKGDGKQCEIALCRELAISTEEEFGDSKRSQDRIPGVLRASAMSAVSDNLAMVSGRAKCSHCGRPARPRINDPEQEQFPLCERCGFSCFRCATRIKISPKVETIECKRCKLTWSAGVLGYELVEGSNHNQRMVTVAPQPAKTTKAYAADKISGSAANDSSTDDGVDVMRARSSSARRSPRKADKVSSYNVSTRDGFLSLNGERAALALRLSSSPGASRRSVERRFDESKLGTTSVGSPAKAGSMRPSDKTPLNIPSQDADGGVGAITTSMSDMRLLEQDAYGYYHTLWQAD